MKILFVSPEIETKSRGIAMILRSLMSSAKNEGHEIALLVGYPVNINIPVSADIKTNIEHLQLQHYIRDGLESFGYTKKSGSSTHKLIRAFIKRTLFKSSRMSVNQDLLSNPDPILRNVDFVVKSPYFYQLLTRNFDRLTGWIMKRLTKRYKFDLVISASPDGLKSCHVQNGKLAHFVHDTMPIDLVEAPPQGKSPLRFARHFYSTCFHSDIIMTNSEDTKRKVLNANPNANAHVLYGTASIRRKEVKPSSILVSKGLTPKKFLLFASALEKRKNVTNLIDAYAQVAMEIDMPLVLVGGEGYGYHEIEKKYRNLAHRIRRKIYFMGYVDENDKYALYDNAFAFVFPSVYEGIGLVIIEAMEAGLPVITTNRGALPEAGGDAALYINDPYDSSEIAAAIKRLVNDPQLVKSMIEKGHKAKEKFTFEKFEQRFAKTLESIDY